MRKKTESPPLNAGLSPQRVGPPAAFQTLHAANDNGRTNRTVVMLNFGNVPLQAGEIAVVDALMQSWPSAANDNSEAA